MRPKPTHSNSSLSFHSSTQSLFTGTIGSNSTTTMSSKPKLPKHPTWSGESSSRHVSSPIDPTTPTTSGTAAPIAESQQFPQDDSGPGPSSPTFGAAATVDPPMIPHNENGRRYSRQELLDVWSQMKASGLLNKSSPANFPPLPTVGTEAAKARSRLGIIGGGTAREGSMEYEKFIARTLVPPELYPDTGLSETDSQKSPSPPAQIRLSFKELHSESETRSSSPFLHTPLLPASIGNSSNGLRSTSAHFPIPALDNIPGSTSAPSLQNQPLAESILPPLANLSLSLPDFVAPFSQSASSTWSPFSGTPTSQHAQLQPQMQQLDQDPFMPSIDGATNDQFSPIPVHHQAFPQQQQFPPPPPPPGLSLPPILVPAPLVQWVYLDNSGVMQGPFPGPMMHEWYVNQWLTPDLKIRRVEENEYYTLAEFMGLVGNDSDPFMVPLPRFSLDMQQPFQQQRQQQETIVGQSQAGQKANEDEEAQPALDKPEPEEEEKLMVVPEPIAIPLTKTEPTAKLELELEPEPMPLQEIAVEATPEPSPAPEPVDEPEEPATQQQTGWDVPAVVDNSWGVPEVDNSWATAPGAPSPSKASTTTGASGKHKLQPLPPAPTLLTKLGGESVSPAATPSPTAHASVPTAPWAKNATEKKIKTLSLKEIEEREARAKKLQEHRLQQRQQQQQSLLLQRKVAEIDLTNGNIVTDDLSGSSGSIPPGLPRTSTWAKAVNAPPSVKKTLSQIQKEEEEARQRKAATAAAANSNAMPGVITAQGRKYAEIMSTKPLTPVGLSRTATGSANSSSGDAWTTIGPGGKKAGTTTSATTTTTTTTTSIRRTVSTPVSTATAARKTAVVKPSVSADEFFKWCRLTLKGVNSGVNAEELLTMLLSLPLAGPETVEIIADTVYANSTMMDGRRFAEEFVKRRKAVEGNTDSLVALAYASGDGAGKSKPDDKTAEGWNEVLVKGNAKALKTASTPSGANDGWNSAFKVIGTKKKAKR
ncbi:hypothetical protein POJ06DRAFT_7434 [Lipomyces tetrasporus]|uniref:GYF domain-containing protein n=1 Tax=Lipomyces tetrasporus TaxID=54092 RepID=A0AAD7QZN6_9ASCO|nr:uncharacterized protein POJ06DRAFT_7434 [Lipomyces tetrasporus]KAJ8103806.1 hypothetical protein POJ06DRAFT_7434 [Lipomyces tetrasporus]